MVDNESALKCDNVKFFFEDRGLIYVNYESLLSHLCNPLDSYFFGDLSIHWNKIANRILIGPTNLRTKCLTIKEALDMVASKTVASYFIRNGITDETRTSVEIIDSILSQGILKRGRTEQHCVQLRCYLLDLIQRRRQIPKISEGEEFIGPLWETYTEMLFHEELIKIEEKKQKRHVSLIARLRRKAGLQ